MLLTSHGDPMTELFALLIGLCSLNYCSFSSVVNPDGHWLAVRVYDKSAEVIEMKYFDVDALGFDVAEKYWRKDSGRL